MERHGTIYYRFGALLGVWLAIVTNGTIQLGSVSFCVGRARAVRHWALARVLQFLTQLKIFTNVVNSGQGKL